eukprot:gene448-3784_t
MDEFLGGFLSGCVEVSLMQPTVYYKNASQQQLPFTLQPNILYRGVGASVINMAILTGLQFPLTSMAKNVVTRESNCGEQRKLYPVEQMTSGFIGGVLSGFACCPLELTIINQQRHGGSMRNTVVGMCRIHGGSVLFRGLTTSCLREGIFTAGYLGLGPIAAEHLRLRYDIGKTQSDVFGAISAGIVSSVLSHPIDTVKTCMQGDPSKQIYTTVRGTLAKLWTEGGVRALYRGAPWRVGRTICSFFIFGKCREILSHFGIMSL